MPRIHYEEAHCVPNYAFIYIYIAIIGRYIWADYVNGRLYSKRLPTTSDGVRLPMASLLGVIMPLVTIPYWRHHFERLTSTSGAAPRLPCTSSAVLAPAAWPPGYHDLSYHTVRTLQLRAVYGHP